MMIMAVLSRRIPRRRLTEMMLFGEKLGADEAARLGLVNRAVAPEELDAAVQAITDAIATKSATTVRLGLRAIAAQDDLDLERALPMLRDRLAEVPRDRRRARGPHGLPREAPAHDGPGE